MHKNQIANEFTKSVIKRKERKNAISSNKITTVLIVAALSVSFVNEACKSSGEVSKSQVIYRKIEDKLVMEVMGCFWKTTIRFLKKLKFYSRNRFFVISFDITEEPFYGDFSKAKDKIYLHAGSVAKGSSYHYKYLTVSITCNTGVRYILNGVILPVGYYVEDFVYEMTKLVTEILPVGVVLFDRGFDSWGVIYKLKKLDVPYLIFWKKQGDWYKEHIEKLKEGEFVRINREDRYNRNKTVHKVSTGFVIVKQLEYDGEKYDWVFATNLKLKTAESLC